MFARKVSVRLKPNSLDKFTNLMEREILPWLRRQKGFLDLITLALPDGSEVATISFWDQEDMFGPQEAYAKLESHDARRENFLVIGPWNHGQWGGTTRHLGAIQFGEPTTDEFRKRYEAPFFAHYLKDENGFSLKDTATFETGSNRWREYTHWPPSESRRPCRRTSA